jgi:beta-galactosidase
MVKGVLSAVMLAVLLASTAGFAEVYTGEPSNRVKINFGETPWKFIKSDPQNAMTVAYNDANAILVGIPHTWNDTDNFINEKMGGDDGSMLGGPFWYRKHFTVDNKYSGKKIFLEFEGAHVGIQVYVNGTLMTGSSAVNPQATHVVGFIGFAIDITDKVIFGADNVVACRVSKSGGFYTNPSFSLVFRFGQGLAGMFRPVWLHITDKVHVPLNHYSNTKQWGTYVATSAVADDGSSATVKLQTNVQNDGAASQVAVTTKIVDAKNNVIWSGDAPAQTIASGAAYVFDQTATIANPHLWYPNNSPYGTPYMHKVYHIVKVNGATVDVIESPLGIRYITWDKDFPYFNGKKHLLYGASARYDYPGLGTALPPEVEWRDAKMLANIGGSLWRPGHSSCSPGFIDACDQLGIMLIQPSGEGEGAFNGTSATDYNGTLKTEIQRDIIVRDRNHPSILAWEISNGPIATSFAQSLQALAAQWEPVNTRKIADRTPNSANGYLLSCTVVGCENGVKSNFPNNPAWGAEWWSDYGRMARYEYDYEIAFCADYLNSWVKTRAKNCFGMAQWYMSETPGEDGNFLPYKALPQAQWPATRTFGCSMLDINRLPKFLYWAYEACWVPYATRPVVHLAHHWNRTGAIRVNAFSNCPKVRLLINGNDQGIKTPNSAQGVSPNNDHAVNATCLPFQCWWDVTWATGTVRVEGLDANNNVVCFEEKKTAGAPDHLVLTVDPHITKPNGESFRFRANGSDAALILAKVVDANGIWCPEATGLINWTVSGPGVYRGGSDQYCDLTKPKNWHSPGDHELTIEGGMSKVAVRTTFTTGTVSVSATSGTMTGSTSFVVDSACNGCTGAIGRPVSIGTIGGLKTHLDVSGRTIRYFIAQSAGVSVDILNANGRVVQRMTPAKQAQGWHSVAFAKNARGSGVYFVRLSVDGEGELTKRIIDVK